MTSVNQLLFPGTTCVDALSFLLGLNSLESKIYFHLVQNGLKTVGELMLDISRNQSTTHVALQKLVTLNVVKKEKRTKKPKGYEYVYSALEPENVKTLLHSNLLKMSDKLEQCINTFDSDSLRCKISFV